MKKIIFKLFLAVILIFSSDLTYAEGGKDYIGVGLAHSTIDVTFPVGAMNSDTSGIAFKLFAGREIKPNFALEVGYAQFGEATANFVSSREKVTVKSNALFVTAIGKIPINDKANYFGKLGVHFWSLDFQSKFNTPPYSGSGSGSSTDFMYGLGVDFKTDNGMTVRLEWERYEKVGDGTKIPCPCVGKGIYSFNPADVDVLGVSLIHYL